MDSSTITPSASRCSAGWSRSRRHGPDLLAAPAAGRERAHAGDRRAIQEGAAAYLKRQYLTIAAVAVVPFLLLGFYNELGWGTALGFLSAPCSRRPRASSA